LTPGNILHDTKFEFKDGEIGNKLVVVLGSSAGIVVAVKTTSNSRSRGIDFGCQLADRWPNFHLPLNSCCLEKPTWICLDEFYDLSQQKLFDKAIEQTVRTIGMFPSEVTRLVQECAVQSLDITSAQEAIVRRCFV
jgi:hypothetical protein